MALRPLAPDPVSNVGEYTVSQLAGSLKRTVEDAYGHVRLRGEISGFRGPHGSGHSYFSIKDERAVIDAIVWKGVYPRVRQHLAEGLEVIATGKVTTYPNRSKYQIVVEALEPAGEGALMALLEARKKQLAAEGLFAEGRKRALPRMPRTVAIVTSPTGAVIRDILHRLSERLVERVLVWPVRVQGEGAAEEIARAVRGFNAEPPVDGDGVDCWPRPDLLIVARGGGSLEDLWAFNEEAVVRAVAESAIPLISAVGHETDTTLIDFASDRRAPTPTAAAEIAAPLRSDLIEAVERAGFAQARALRLALDRARAALVSGGRGLGRAEDVLVVPRQRLDAAAEDLPQAVTRRLRERGVAVERAGLRLAARGPEAALRLMRQRLDSVAGRLRADLALRPAERQRERLSDRAARLDGALSRVARERSVAFHRTAPRLTPTLLEPALRRRDADLRALDARRRAAHEGRLERRRIQLDAGAKLLHALSYRGVLERGFVVVRGADGRTLRRAEAVASGTPLALEFADGTVSALAGEPGAPAPKARPRATKPRAQEGSARKAPEPATVPDLFD
ncbi:MAG: exodeoxyribonuclease VII large subunit [Pseudomonadota bacterium]